MIGVVVVALAIAPSGWAIDVWTPETGEVQLEELPRQSVEARRQHALALIGAGQWAGGVAELRELMAAEPNAEWVPEARFAIARGLLAGGRGAEAFDELENFLTQHPDSPLAVRVRPLQFSAAREEATADVGSGAELYERLMDIAADADDPAMGALAQKEMADAFFDARWYLDAEDQYLAFISFFPSSEWVPYCWYRVAECEWEMSQWLDLGLEHSQVAEQSFRDFAEGGGGPRRPGVDELGDCPLLHRHRPQALGCPELPGAHSPGVSRLS
jgi:outer membrane protein assembly factor BamD (BamD/ComL family)